MGVPSSNPSLAAVRDDLDLSGNFNVLNDRGRDRLQKFSGNIALSEYAGTCNSILRVSPASDGPSSYNGNRSKPSYFREGAPRSPLCSPQGNGWRVQASGNNSSSDQWVEGRFYGRVTESGSYKLDCTCTPQVFGQMNGRFAQFAVISYSSGYGSGSSNMDVLDMNIYAPSPADLGRTISLTTSRSYVVIYVYAIIKAGQGDTVFTADFTNVKLRKV